MNRTIRYPGDCRGMFAPQNVQMIKDSALNIIERIGMRVTDPAICGELLGNGFSLTDGRLTVPGEAAGSFLNDMIAREKERDKDENGRGAVPVMRYLDGWINNYPHSYYDPDTGAIVPYNTDALIKMTAFCNRVGREYSFTPNVPGCPKDVPPACEAIARFVIGNKYLDDGTYPEPMCRYSAKYLFAMCEITGHRMSSLPVYLATPLTIGDESFYTVLENKSRLESVYIGSMPSFGANTPLSISGGLALVLAESLLGAMIVHSLTGLETGISVPLLPFDFKDINQVFGTPEMLLLSSVCDGFRGALFGSSGSRAGSVEIHTHTIHPDAQAAGEKAMAMAAAYMKQEAGESLTFRGMGILGMDEIFSPAQLYIDAELLHYMRRLEEGYELDRIPEDFLDEIREGLVWGFVPSERTAGRYREFMHHSGLFTRANLSAQMRAGMPCAGERAAAAAKIELRRKPEMVLDPAAARELDRLLAEAVNNRGFLLK